MAEIKYLSPAADAIEASCAVRVAANTKATIAAPKIREILFFIFVPWEEIDSILFPFHAKINAFSYLIVAFLEA